MAGSRTAAAAGLLVVLVAATPVRAQEANPADNTPAPGFWDRATLTGDWGGLRTTLSNDGVTFTIKYTSDLQANVAGGIRRGAVYDGLFQPEVDIDLDKAADWKGATAAISMLQISGPSASAWYVGNLMDVSSINGRPATRLYNAWLQQNAFNDVLSVKVGLMNVDAEFFTSTTASLFVSSTFGWPGILAVDLPGGGPAYPLSAPMVRVKLQPTPELSVMAAVFSGDPTGGNGSNSLSTLQPDGTTISFNGGVFVMAEAQYAINQGKDAKGIPATFKLGGWYHSSSRFADQRFDNMGLSLADPLSDGVPYNHHGDWGLYGIADATLYQSSRGAALSAFARVAGTPDDQNIISFYADAGLTYKGLIPGRDSDSLGIAAAYARIGNRARSLDLDFQAFGLVFTPLRSQEAILELTYQAQVTGWWTLQPDLQAIFNPSGRVANANNTVRPNALVLGLRSQVTF
jgi:porin